MPNKYVPRLEMNSSSGEKCVIYIIALQIGFFLVSSIVFCLEGQFYCLFAELFVSSTCLFSVPLFSAMLV